MNLQFAIILSILTAASTAFANPQLKPTVNSERYFRQVQEIHTSLTAKEKSLQEVIFDKTISDEMKARFESINKDRETKENYHTATIYEDQRYQQGAKDLVDWTLKKLMQYHLENTLKDHLEKSVKREASTSRSSGVQAASAAVGGFAALQKALKNTTVDWGPALKTNFRYDLPTGRFKMAMTSVVVDADVDCRVLPLRFGGTASSGEPMNVGMSRKLKFLSASTGVQYAVGAEVLNYGINKELVGPLSAAVNQVHNLKEPQKDETVVRLNWGASF